MQNDKAMKAFFTMSWVYWRRHSSKLCVPFVVVFNESIILIIINKKQTNCITKEFSEICKRNFIIQIKTEQKIQLISLMQNPTCATRCSSSEMRSITDSFARASATGKSGSKRCLSGKTLCDVADCLFRPSSSFIWRASPRWIWSMPSQELRRREINKTRFEFD